MKEASRIFSEMRDSGLVPDVITYNTFVASYAADSMFEEAIDVVKYMIKNGCKRNQNTYNSIVDGYCKHNRRADASMFVSSLHELDPHVSKEEECRNEAILNLKLILSISPFSSIKKTFRINFAFSEARRIVNFSSNCIATSPLLEEARNCRVHWFTIDEDGAQTDHDVMFP
ncbi:hypothetical protein GH714_032212 [Hevea brasiliensis]|uniref:Pentacotripeptide-repeat region of PRORP domain-containing protein n=1 Tax=Hevea brasiliensis TaxID=3981 RepID=A0A6A6N691_HEVBR|nr:hypothetical protein GH714_032212 [Hevea brasiliensis]